MADQKLTALNATTTALTGDILYIVNDPTGTPASNKITFDNLQKSVKTLVTATFTTLSGTTITATSLASLNISATNISSTLVTTTIVACTYLTATNMSGLVGTGNLIGSNIVVSVSGSVLANTTISIPQAIATNSNVVFASTSSTSINASTITAITIACTNLTVINSGFEPAIATGTASQFWRGDKVFAVPAGSGNVNGSGNSTSGNLVFYGDTTGTLITDRNNTVGILTATSLGCLNFSSTNLQATTITATSVNGATVSASSLGALNLASATATHTTISATTITATSLGSLNLSTTNFQATSVTTTSLGALNCSVTNFQATGVTSTNIGGLTITATTVTSTNIGALNLSATNIQASYITASYLSGATISNLLIQGVSFVIDGGTTTIGNGVIKGFSLIPYNATITNIYLIADTGGNIAVDIWKAPYSATNFPTAGNSIFGTAIISLSNAQAYSLASGFTGSIVANDVLRLNVSNCTTVTNCTVILAMKKL